MLKLILPYAIIIALFVGGCFLVKSIFSGSGSSDDKLNKQLLAAKDSVISSKNDNIALHERLIEEKDKATEALISRDSILDVHYHEAELTYKKINETIRNIPNRINRIATNNDSLRLILSDY